MSSKNVYSLYMANVDRIMDKIVLRTAQHRGLCKGRAEYDGKKDDPTCYADMCVLWDELRANAKLYSKEHIKEYWIDRENIL